MNADRHVFDRSLELVKKIWFITLPLPVCPKAYVWSSGISAILHHIVLQFIFFVKTVHWETLPVTVW